LATLPERPDSSPTRAVTEIVVRPSQLAETASTAGCGARAGTARPAARRSAQTAEIDLVGIDIDRDGRRAARSTRNSASP
jgi:hypothetical protein